MPNLNAKAFAILFVGMIAIAPFVGAQSPQPKVRKIASIPGVDIDEAVRLPNGRVVLYTERDNIMAYDLTTKRGTLVTRGFGNGLSISRAGDRIAFGHESDPGTTGYIWSMPIDPRTGLAAGPAERVSRSAGDCPSISPDGKLVAFARDRDGNNQVQDLAVVPTTGGTERILAQYGKGLCKLSWSADGNWIFLRRSDTSISLERVPAAGGQSESMISNLLNFAGSINGQIAFYRPDPVAVEDGRIAYVMAAGARGGFMIPSGSHSGGVWSSQTLLTRTTRPSAVHLLNVADGTVRDLPGSLLSPWPTAWSPDGRRLALLHDSGGGHYQISVVNSDGSRPRGYPVTVNPSTASMHWSPNGEKLAFYAGAGASLALLDTATGNTRTVFAAPDAWYINFIWRPDGESIVLIKFAAGRSEREVYEVRLDGTQRKLRDIGAEFPFMIFLSDQLIVGGADGDSSNLYAVIPSAGGAAWQKVSGGTGRRGFPGVSNDGRWLLFLLRSNRAPETRITSVELTTTAGDSSRTLNLPFETLWSDSPFLVPDGRGTILLGKVPGEVLFKLFFVPLDGTTPRVLATLPGTGYDGRLYLSPDAKTVAFSSKGAPASTIYELDLSPILRSIGKH